MLTRTIVALIAVLALLGASVGSGSSATLAATGACAEPNDSAVTACLPGSDSPAPGSLQAAFGLRPPLADGSYGLSAGALQSASPFIPRPARAYLLSASDVGPGFREVAREESEDGITAFTRVIAPNARPVGEVWFSTTNVGMVDNLILVLPDGSSDAVGAAYSDLLAQLRGKYGANVQPAVGWGSEQVYSYAWADQGVMARGIALKHRNVLVLVEMLGLEQHATWDRAAGLTRIVESRIHAAIQ